jgi:flagellar assembly factor FliW
VATEILMSHTANAGATEGTETISVSSRTLGALEIPVDDVITFTAPIAGFADSRRYVLVPHTLADGTDKASVAWLQSLDAPFQAFVVTDPWMIDPDYAPEISDADAADMGLDSFQHARVFAILTIPDDPREMSINLRAPIVVNAIDRRAKQVVLLGDEYGTRHPVSVPALA